jgi:hypothetical protein
MPARPEDRRLARIFPSTAGTRRAPQVSAQPSVASGVVTAFYLRSSDDYNTENRGFFDEIDFEVGGVDPWAAWQRRQKGELEARAPLGGGTGVGKRSTAELETDATACWRSLCQPSTSRLTPVLEWKPQRARWPVAQQLLQGHVR